MIATPRTERNQARRSELIAVAEESREPFDPEVVLFVDESEESQEARRMLDRAGERYRTLAGSGPDIPAAVCGGIVFSEPTGLEDLLAGLAAFDTAADAALDNLIPRLGNGTLAPVPGRRERSTTDAGKDHPKRAP